MTKTSTLSQSLSFLIISLLILFPYNYTTLFKNNLLFTLTIFFSHFYLKISQNDYNLIIIVNHPDPIFIGLLFSLESDI